MLWWAVLVWIDVGVGGLKVKFGVLLPERPVSRTAHPCNTLPIATAEERLIAQDLTPLNWFVDGPTSPGQRRNSTELIDVQFDYRNSFCSDTYGPIHAMEIYYHGAGCLADEDPKSPSVEAQEVQVFYGPCCKYALSPIVKYASLWNVPVITPGGLTSRFNDDVDYVMLTRFTAPFEKVAEFVSSLLGMYDWWHVSFLVHNNLGPDKDEGHPMCYDIMEAAVAVIVARYDRTQRTAIYDATVNVPTSERCDQDSCWLLHKVIFNENYYDDYDSDEIMDEIRNASRGK